MAKKRDTGFVCTDCGQNYPKWQGHCSACGSWNTIKEFKGAAYPAGDPAGGRVDAAATTPRAVKALHEIAAAEVPPRIGSDFPDVDAVLGGGVVAGAVVLIGGEPGIGKSTLLLQLFAQWQQRDARCLYISGEESLQQLYLRARRLQIHDSTVAVLSETSCEHILARWDEHTPAIVVIDSIQTLYSSDIEGPPGGVAQIRHCVGQLIARAKACNCALFLIGHVTKQGAIAGPRLIEHMVDTVISFESDSQNMYRIVRSIKNRFGPAGEIAVLSMDARGLSPVHNPSQLFLPHETSPQPGTCATAIAEGSRILVIEIQALVTPSHYGVPQRVCAGLNQKKLALLCAVLEKHAGVDLGTHDVFINVAGGLTVTETAADAAICAALLSSFLDKTLAGATACIGEIGLSGELRPLHRMHARIRECAKLGIGRCIVPGNEKNAEVDNARVQPCTHVSSLAGVVFQ